MFSLFLAALSIVSVTAADEACQDRLVKGEPWHEDGSPKYNCEWYAGASSRCKSYGSKNPWGGFNAKQACCTCGGGTSESVCEDLRLANGKEWHDLGGKSTDCAWYAAKKKRCKKYGDMYAFEGLTANEACCACNGGLIVDEDDEEDQRGAISFQRMQTTLRLFNLTVADITQGNAIGLVKALSKVLGVPVARLSIDKYEDFELRVGTTKPRFVPKKVRGAKPTSSNRPGSPGSKKPTRKPVRKAVDMKFTAKVFDFESYQSKIKRAVAKNTFTANIRPVLKDVTRVTNPGATVSLDLACFDKCNTGSPREEDGEKCYCSQVCLTFGDCCPSFFTLQCRPPKLKTYSPTPRGPGDHWKSTNQQINIDDPNRVPLDEAKRREIEMNYIKQSESGWWGR
jgi:hypothetical protein